MAKIIGNTTATTMAVPDWDQQDSTRADYIKNKPTVLTEAEVVQLINDNSIQEVEDGAVSYEKLHEDLARQLVGENTFFGHKGYYITAINTEEKWIALTDSTTKPDYPEIGDDVIDPDKMKAPYAGVYQVTSDNAVTITNETGHSVSLEAGETKYFYLIKGHNNLTFGDTAATLTFTSLEGNGLDYQDEVSVDNVPLTSTDRIEVYEYRTVYPNNIMEVDVDIEVAGIYSIQMQLNDSNTNLLRVETDTGFCGTIQQYQYGWNQSPSGSTNPDDLLMVYLREGENTLTIINDGPNFSSVGTIAICQTKELDSSEYPQYVGKLSISNCGVIPSDRYVEWVYAAQDQTGYYNGYAGGTDTDAELAPGESVEITVENLPYTGIYAFQLYIEDITNGDVANIRVMTADGYYSDYELTQTGAWTNRMNPPKDMPIYMNEGDNTVYIINIGTTTVTLDDTDCGRLDASGAEATLDFLYMVQTSIPKDNSFQYKCDNYDFGYAVGDEFSMVNGAHYDFCGVITNIEGKKVYYEEDLPFNKVDKATNDFDDHIFFVPSKPNAGAVQIVTIAFATGIDTKAAGKSSFGGGRNNVAGGDYSFVAGRNNLASYCAAALGLNTQAKGRYTFSAGYFAKALGEYSAAINNYTIAEGQNAFAHGYGTLANGDSMVAGGKCNKTEDGVIVVYGNGTSWDNRRDAYTLDWDGYGWYSGGIYIGRRDYNSQVLTRSQIQNILDKNYYDKIDLDKYYAQRTTTLSGYGIQDAYTKDEVDNKLSSYGITDSYTKNEVDNMHSNIEAHIGQFEYALTEKANTTDTYNKTDVDNLIGEVESIAKGRATGYVFSTVDEMNNWLLDYDNTSKLTLGDNLYIRATDVPDYWWDGSQVQELETQKVDLTEYAKTQDLTEYAKKVTTLSGYGITDAYTKEEVSELHSNIISNFERDLAKKADITNVYTKAETDAFINDINSAIDNKAEKSTTLAGYGITDTYTKDETAALIESKINEAIQNVIGGSY